jgi:hypothetical protein
MTNAKKSLQHLEKNPNLFDNVIDIVTSHFYATPEIRARNNRNGISRSVFCVVRVTPVVGNESLNTFLQKQTSGKEGNLLLLCNMAVNRLCQKYRLCFPWDPCKVVITESNFEAGNSVQFSSVVSRRERERTRTSIERVLGSHLLRAVVIDCD